MCVFHDYDQVMEIGSKQWKNLIEDGSKVFDVCLNDKILKQFECHAIEMLKWNVKVNLTAIRDPYDIAIKHFIDSLALIPMITEDSRVLDIGTGGGFPGIPIKAVKPSLNLTLIDSSQKKINFIKHLIRQLKLENTSAYHSRAELIPELLSHKTYSDNSDLKYVRNEGVNGGCKLYDIIISRAFAPLDKFVKLSMPLISKDGMIIALKGRIPDEELVNTSTYLDQCKKDHSIKDDKYMLPYIDAKRSLITIRFS